MKAAAFRRILVMTGGFGVAVGGLQAQTAAQIIAKARAYLGSPAKLDTIRSVRFIGTMQSRRLTAEGPETVRSTLEVIFQKPFQERQTRTSATEIYTTGLDNLEAWERIRDVKDREHSRFRLLGPSVVRRLRANTWENLYFYKGLEKQDGQVQVLGPATIDGVATIKVAFIHEPGVVFYRYFDKATGRLVLTKTSTGDTIKQEGEIMVDGLRFPKKLITTTPVQNAQGKVVDGSIVITFSKIILNERFPDSLFAVPPLTPPAEDPVAEPASPVGP